MVSSAGCFSAHVIPHDVLPGIGTLKNPIEAE